MKKTSGALMCALLFATLTCFAQVSSTGSFRFQNIDVPGAQSTIAQGINDLGQIAGFARDAAGGVRGFVRDGDDIRTIVFPNATKTFPLTINNSGTVGGGYSDGTRIHGFVLEHGQFKTIDFPGDIFTEIVDVNERGDVAGTYLDADFGFHGFTFDKNGFTSIDDAAQTWPTPSTEVLGINNRKTVSGVFLDFNHNIHSFLLSGGVFQPADLPGAVSTALEGLNDSADLVGFFDGPDNIQHGYLQRRDQVTTFDFPGVVGTSFPFQINNSGTIVGISSDSLGHTHSFIADQLRGNAAGPENANDPPPVIRAPLGSCSPAGLVDNPEPIRNPGACN